MANDSSSDSDEGWSYDFKYIQNRVVREGVVHFKFVDGTTTPGHADLFLLDSNKHKSPILADIINETFGESKREIPLPEFVTPAALDYYLCKMYEVPWSTSIEEEEGSEKQKQLEFYFNVAELYRWAGVDAFEGLDTHMCCCCDWLTNKFCSNESAFRIINRVQEYSHELPSTHSKCMEIVLHALTVDMLDAHTQGSSTSRHQGFGSLLASDDAVNLSPQTWRAVFYAFVNSIRAPFHSQVFGQTAKRVNEEVFMDRLKTFISRDSQKRVPFEYAIETRSLTFQNKPVEVIPSYDFLTVSDSDEEADRANKEQDAEVVDGNAWRPLVDFKREKGINPTMHATVLVVNNYDTAIREKGGFPILVSVSLKNQFSGSKRPRISSKSTRYYPQSNDFGKILDVQLSFENGVSSAKSTANTSRYFHEPWASSISERTPFPPNTTREEEAVLKPYFKKAQVFQVHCDESFLKELVEAESSKIILTVSAEVSKV